MITFVVKFEGFLFSPCHSLELCIQLGKKACLSEQCKEIEGNKRMGETGDLFKKLGDTKGTVHAKMVTVKDRNGKDLTEAEEIKKRWQEYTELYEKGHSDLDNHDDVIIHLEPDILKCEVK